KSQTSKNSIQPQLPRKDLGGMAAAANEFLQALTAKQKEAIQFSFDDNERLNWHYVPKSRNGLPLKDLSGEQRESAMKLLRTALSDSGYQKTTAIIQLEGILREAEGRPAGDSYRDSGKYYISIFGNPASDSIWGW